MRVGYDEDVASGGNEVLAVNRRVVYAILDHKQYYLSRGKILFWRKKKKKNQFKPQLRLLMVMKEGVQLPTIIVVGDLSSGKYSVLNHLPVLVFLEARSTTHNEAAKSSKSNAREVQWQESPCRGIPQRNGHKSCN
ncbi:hypothetical protein QQP08_015777 [Theobroma cacao]|nr:hypothetical protein QQP08_015777 [Theobroma cacao]